MPTAEQCWKAVTERDAGADGRFFYAVKTTGVFCRPNCASRLPRRENVLFYSDADAAAAAGFRPCKRCRPTDASPAERHLRAVEKACAIIRASDSPPSLEALAKEVGISRFHFQRLFKQIVGVSPRDFAATCRRERLAQGLASGELVTAAIYDAGYGSSSRAYEAAPEGLGMTPGARRSGGRGERIRFAVTPTPVGLALIAATARGICATMLGDDAVALEAELRQRFPAAEIVADDGELKRWAKAVADFITAPGHAPELPLDIQGTAFEAQVWRALRRIPVGSTITYRALAESLGRPTAVRAVARACASNKIAVLVPCHRVIGSDGKPHGYRWGIARKEALLARERRERSPTRKAS